MRCTSAEWPRLVTPVPRHNAPPHRGARLSPHASGKLARQHLSTAHRLRENTRSGDYLCFNAVAGNSLISTVFTVGVVGLDADLCGINYQRINEEFHLITVSPT
jgi:hypothetical protein